MAYSSSKDTDRQHDRGGGVCPACPQTIGETIGPEGMYAVIITSCRSSVKLPAPAGDRHHPDVWSVQLLGIECCRYEPRLRFKGTSPNAPFVDLVIDLGRCKSLTKSSKGRLGEPGSGRVARCSAIFLPTRPRDTRHNQQQRPAFGLCKERDKAREWRAFEWGRSRQV